jgi:predicted Zn-dependent protease
MIARRAVTLAVMATTLCAAMVPPHAVASTPQVAGSTPPAGTTHPDIVVLAEPQPAPAVYVPQDKDERGLWMQMEEEERKLKTSNFVIRQAQLNDYVHRVFCKTVGPECASIRIYLMRTAYFNANMAPNGAMQIWSGLFLRTRDEAQLAAVLAHEFAHYQERHSLMLFRQAKAKAASATFLAMFGLVGALFALGEISALFRFSRDMEARADALSVEMIARAGYDPMAAARIWEQIGAEADATAVARNTKSRKDKNGGMFASHPPTTERLVALKALAASIKTVGAPRLNREEYRAALAPMWASLIDDQIKLNDFGATEYLIGFLAADGWTPSLNYARGELYRARGRPEDLVAAAGFYRQATQGPDAPVEAWRGLGLSLLRTGAQVEGQAALKDYLSRRPDASDKTMIAMLAGV